MTSEMPDEMWFFDHPTMGMLATKYPVGQAVRYTRADRAPAADCWRCNGTGSFGSPDNPDMCKCDPCPAPERKYTDKGYLIVDRPLVAPDADAEMTAIYGILQWMANEDANYSGDEMRGMAKKALNFLNRARDRAANNRAEAVRDLAREGYDYMSIRRTEAHHRHSATIASCNQPPLDNSEGKE